MKRYEKYIDCEFGYNDDNRQVYLLYGGYGELNGIHCCRCNKPLRKGHQFTESEEGTLWVFGNECVHYVFGVGLKSK